VGAVVVDRLALDEPLSSDRELQAAERRRAEVGEVDLAQRRRPQREIRVAGELVCRREAVLVRGRPRVRVPRRAGGLPRVCRCGERER
jgi:hypothetical protein